MAKKAVKDQPARRWDVAILAAAGLAVVQIAAVWLPMIPLGVPNEWTWDRIPYGGPEAATLFLRLFAVLPAMALYLAMCVAGDARIAAASRTMRRVWLVMLAGGGFLLMWTIQEAPTNAYDRLGRDPLVLYFPSSSGYFTEARDADAFAEYLANYEQLMSRGDVLHLGTHPPGLIALHRGLLAVYRQSPWLVDLTLTLRPESVQQTQEVVAMLAQAEGRPLSHAELAELWGASLLTRFAAVAVVVPLFLCATRTAGPVAGWRAACLWPLVPALTIFLPKSDALYPLIGMAFLACWYRRGNCPGPFSSLLAGVFLWIGMMLSLAMLPVAVLASLFAMQDLAMTETAGRRHAIVLLSRSVAIASAVFAALTLATYLALDLNLIAVWRWNFRNHAAFYEEFQRTYWKWLLINPLELAMAVGLPAVVAAVLGSIRQPASTSIALPIAVVIALLWLSGKNSGEAARLWLFLMPWIVWLSAYSWSADDHRHRWRVILLLQLAVGFLTSVRIGGFGFAELIKNFG